MELKQFPYNVLLPDVNASRQIRIRSVNVQFGIAAGATAACVQLSGVGEPWTSASNFGAGTATGCTTKLKTITIGKPEYLTLKPKLGGNNNFIFPQQTSTCFTVLAYSATACTIRMTITTRYEYDVDSVISIVA